MVFEPIEEVASNSSIPLIKSDSVLMSAISLLVLQSNNLINDCKRKNADKIETVGVGAEMFRQLLMLVKDAPQHV